MLFISTQILIKFQTRLLWIEQGEDVATVTGYTAARMKVIEDGTVVNGAIVNGDLIFTRFDGTQINAGPVVGSSGPPGPTGPEASFGGYKEPLNDIGNVSGSIVLDFSIFNIWRIVPTGAVTIVFSNLPPVGSVSSGTIIVANSNHAITWPAGTKFPNAIPPTLSGETYLSLVARSTHVTVGAAWKGVA